MRMQDAMREASRIVLDGFELRTDVIVVRHPDRFMDERGAVMWERVMTLLDRAGSGNWCCPLDNGVLFPRQHLYTSPIEDATGQ